MVDIDIIMGVYNEEKTIKRAVDSIINQSIGNWRLLICDDASVDTTANILYDYAKLYPEKIYVYKNDTNRGLAYCLNKLIHITKAKYIARMDADDFSMENRLEIEKKFLDENLEYAVVGSAINKFDDTGVFATVMYPETPVKENLLWSSPFAHPTIMIRRSVMLELGGYRDIAATVRCEDYDLWMRFFEEGYKGYNIQKPLLYYFEGRLSYVKRKFRYRLNEVRIRVEGYKRNRLLPVGYFFAIKPILVGLMPIGIIKKITYKGKKKKDND